MPRNVTATLQDAIDNPGSYKFISRATAYPSNVFFETIDDDFAVSGADAIGIVNDPMAQDIVYDVVSGLVTFFGTADLKYAKQGSATVVTTAYDSSVKPGVFGSKIFLSDGPNIRRYSIDFSLINSGSTTPLTLEETVSVTFEVKALQGISDTECVAICEDDGGFRVAYIDDTTEILSTGRFMFPKIVDWDESTRTMDELAKFTAGGKLGGKVFAYASAAFSGMVHGMYYDPVTETWSDIFTAMPTDITVSQCEFRVSNAFVRNNKIYMCGMLRRLDAVNASLPYTLVMGSDDGLTFSIDRFSLVTNIGYRFLAHVGTDNYLYIANSNRVSKKLSTWVFDGESLSTCPQTPLPMGQIVRYSASADLSGLEMELKGGDEGYVDHAHLIEGSKIVLEAGYQTSIGDEYVTYANYIIDAISFDRTKGGRSFMVSCVHEGRWKSSGLSMPFYAEITGVSSTYDSMNKETGIMYSAPSNARFKNSFWVDFWQHEGYTNSGAGITGVSLTSNGGASAGDVPGSHKVGFILSSDVKDIIGSEENPEITDTSITAKLYGWSSPGAVGQPNDTVNLVLIHTDAEGDDEQTAITTGTDHWPITYPYAAAGSAPVIVTVTGLAAGRRIKKAGLVLQAPNTTKFCPWRIEFTANVKVPIQIDSVGATWVKQDDGTFKIPGSGLPFVMFSQKPYNAFNFTLASKFTNTVSGGVSGYPVAVGLVGLGKDAANFILARYDKVSNKAQLVKVSEGVETTLNEVTPGFTINNTMQIQFSHRDGNFKVYLYNDSLSRFSKVIDYDWEAADGFMCASVTSSLKCGLYGAIQSPMVQILSYSFGTTETGARTDGIPMAPGESHADFPSSGNIRIGESIYSYSSKIAMPTYVRGPSQLRAQNKYSPPFGNGSYGLQCLDLNWTGNPSLLVGYLIAADGGYSFVSTGSLWQPFITTGGVRIYLTNRSQHYSANPQIAKFPASLSTRIWVTGGFGGINKISGEGGTTIHSTRDYARLELGGTIFCHWFMGAGGEANQTTIQDLLQTVCALSGIPVEFPGNFTDDSITVAGETAIYTDEYAEGFDMFFELAAPTSFELRTDVKILPDNYEEKDAIQSDTGLTVKITDNTGGDYVLTLISTPSNTDMFKMAYTAGEGYQMFRVLFHEKNVSLFQCHRWITTVTFDELVYGDAISIKAYHASSVNFLNVAVRDLAELREAVYIDLETDGASAMQSIIQERPVEIIPLPNGGFQVFYEYGRPISTLALAPASHNESRKIPPEAASDAIVYGSKDVKTLQFAPFASLLGLSTKLFRLPDLNVGALEAAIRMLKKAYQRRKMTTIQARPQLAPLNGERLDIDYTLAGLDKNVTGDIIIEGISLTFQAGKEVESTMTITGREYSV